MKAYFVPLKEDVKGYGGHIMFLELGLGTTNIFSSSTYPNALPSQRKIGTYTGELNTDYIRNWCYAHFKNCGKHPAIYKVNFDTMQQELCMDNYIEDFIKDNYDEIMERLNER